MKAGRALLLGLLIAFAAVPVIAQQSSETFVVEEIRLEGLQRIAEGTVLSYLPVETGDRLDREATRRAIRELYDTGFFDNVILERDGNTLVVKVKERPTIASIDISGNRQIETDMLRQAMRDQGIDEGRVLNERVIEELEQELFRTYYSQGRYGVDIVPTVRERGSNQVDLNIEIEEGPVAKIRQVNIVGNESFDDDELLDRMELRESSIWTFFSSGDQYSREKLSGDLETLRSFYMDRGFADFGVSNVQVSISQDRTDVFITINIDEGDIYTVSESDLIGEFPVPVEQLEPFLQLNPGDTYSLAAAEQTADYIEQRLGASGYAHAEVSPSPELNRENKTVAVTFFVEPGERIYVREIRVNGSESTDDIVYRRELRQFEKAQLSNVRVDRSRVRMQRLPFVEQVNIEEVPVQDSSDEVDLEVDVRERNFGEFQIGVGYGGFSGLSANASVQNNNLFGLGHQGEVELQRNDLGEFFQMSHTDPYAGANGVSRTIGGFYSSQSLFALGQSPVSTTSSGFNIRYGLPISEFDAFRYGVSFRRSEFIQQSNTSQEFSDFISQHGEQFQRGPFQGSRMDSAELNLSWVRDTRNRSIFADRGSRSLLGLDVSLPSFDLEYWMARWNQESYLPLGGEYILKMDGELSYGEPYGDETLELPPFKQVFSGGPGTVRGYQNARLGPVDSNGRPYGGALKFNLQNEFILPNFLQDDDQPQSTQYRFFLFVDTGYVWSDIDQFDTADLRTSAGVGASWLTPMGLLRFSWAEPFNVREEDRERGIIDRFQIDLGASF